MVPGSTEKPTERFPLLTCTPKMLCGLAQRIEATDSPAFSEFSWAYSMNMRFGSRQVINIDLAP